MLRATALVLMGALLGGFAAGCGDDATDTAPATPATTPPPGLPAASSPTATSTPAARAPASRNGFEGKTFESTKVIGFELAKGTTVQLSFADGRLAASAGCNTMSGTYTYEDGTLTQNGPVATTQMACPDLPANQDKWLADLLAGGVTAELVGDTLTISNGDATVTLESAAPAGLPPVVGPNWELTGYGTNSGAETSVPAGATPPSLKLKEDDTVDFYTGCNHGSGPAKFADGFVTFGPLRTTRAACPPGQSATEQAFLAVVKEGKAAAGFDGKNNLSLARDGNRLVFAQGG
jgi:heat shock protein HslJ